MKKIFVHYPIMILATVLGLPASILINVGAGLVRGVVLWWQASVELWWDE